MLLQNSCVAKDTAGVSQQEARRKAQEATNASKLCCCRSVLLSSDMKGKKQIVKGPATVTDVINKDQHAKTLLVGMDGKTQAVAVVNATKSYQTDC